MAPNTPLALRRIILWLVLACCWLLLPVHAQSLLAVPALQAHVVDTTGTLNPAQVQALEDKLSLFEKSNGAQVVLLLVPSTLPEDIASYANRVANTWKIGRKAIGDGLLVIVAKDDRKVRIEVAKTLEGAIPDLAAKQVIDDAITPRFKQGDFAGGLDAAADQLMARIKGETLPTPSADATRNGEGFQWMDLMVFLFIITPVVAAVSRKLMGRNLGSMATGGGIGLLAFMATRSWLLAGLASLVALTWTLLSGFGRPLGGSTLGRHGPGWTGGYGSGGGGGFGGAGGGGFSSGGGGDFGGGGASGDW